MINEELENNHIIKGLQEIIESQKQTNDALINKCKQLEAELQAAKDHIDLVHNHPKTQAHGK
jgi:hypothetical protein